MKTNAARTLDQMGIPYRLVEYEVDETDLSAQAVAAKIGMPAEQVFKTLVASGDKNHTILAVIPGSSELDLKRLAAASGDKRVELVPLKQVQPLTGYVRGGVSPLATKRKYPVFIDIMVKAWDLVGVSGGQRGLQLIVAPADLVQATDATLCDITRS